MLHRTIIVGLGEIEKTSDIIGSPLLGPLLQLCADLGDYDTARQFRLIREQLLEAREQLQTPTLFDGEQPETA